MDYKSILNQASESLKDFNIKNPKLDSELLLSNSLKISRENLLLNLDKKISFVENKKFNRLVEKRKKNANGIYPWI